MSESSLSLQYSDLKAIVGRFLGYGETPTSTQLTDTLRCIHGGLRMFYGAHRWTFLTQTDTITTGDEKVFTSSFATSTFTSASHGYSNNTSVRVRSSANDLPASLSSSTTYYICNAALNTFKLSLTSGGSAVTISDDGSGTLYVREYGYAYDLEDNFGGILGLVVFAAGSSYLPMRETSVESIHEMRAANDLTSTPEYYAIQAKPVDQTTGQRWQMLLYPAPDAEYEIRYQFRVNPENITTESGGTRAYALGGLDHAETILEAALAWGEKFYKDELGIHNMEYQRLLAISIKRDGERAPQHLGYNADRSTDTLSFPWRVDDAHRVSGVSYL